MTIEESIHVAFDETNNDRLRRDDLDDISEKLENTHIDQGTPKDKEEETNQETMP